MSKPADIIQNWIESARRGHLKDGDRFLTADECGLVGRLLGCVLADVEFSKGAPSGIDEADFG